MEALLGTSPVNGWFSIATVAGRFVHPQTSQDLRLSETAQLDQVKADIIVW